MARKQVSDRVAKLAHRVVTENYAATREEVLSMAAALVNEDEAKRSRKKFKKAAKLRKRAERLSDRAAALELGAEQ